MKMKTLRRLIGIVVVVIVLSFVCSFVHTLYNYPEKVMTTKKYHLMIALNDGDKDAEIYYMNKYILNDDYLYDGPVTLKLVAQKYNLDEEELTKLWDDGEYKSMKKFVKKVIKPMIKQAEYNYVTR